MKRIFFGLFIIIFNLIAVGQTIDTTNITTGDAIIIDSTLNITITPPKDFVYIPQYKSFMNSYKETSISVTIHDTLSYYLMVSSMLNNDLTTSETPLISKEELPNGKGFLFTFLFEVQNTPIERMVYLTGDSQKCIAISCNYKQIDKDKHLPELKKSAFSITY